MRCLLVLLTACASVSADPRPPLAIANGRPGAFVLTATAAVELDTMADIEALRDGKWTVVSDNFDTTGGYLLVPRCDGTPSPCTSLAAGAKLAPVPWTGMSCSSQCNKTCRANARFPEGDYRLVVSSCEQHARIAGPAFHLPAPNP